MEGTVDQCACANDSQWDEVKMVCSIKGFDVLLTSIVGTGVICKICIYDSCGSIRQCGIHRGEEKTDGFGSTQQSGPRTDLNSYVILYLLIIFDSCS